MIRLTRAELQKVFTTRMVWGMLAIALAYTALNLVLVAWFAGQTANGAQQVPPLTSPDGVKILFSTVASGTVFAFVVGTMLITGEYRFQTITHTFLTTPRRERVVSAKLAACIAVGLFFGVAAVLLSFGVGIPAILLRDGTVSLVDVGILRVLGGSVVSIALYTVLGLALGSLLRNQIAAIVIGIVWIMLVESLIVGFLPKVGQWLPGGASAAVSGVPVPGGGQYLPAWGGAGLLVGYALVFAAVASFTTIRRDIT